MDNYQQPDYDAMFKASQESKFPKPADEKKQSYDEMYRQSMLKKYEDKKSEKARETVSNPEVLDAYGNPVAPKSGWSSERLGMISLILGGVAFVMVFAGMFLHVLLWLNILLCLTGAGFGIAALLKKSVNKILGILGIILSVFVLLVNMICIIVVAISAGISAIFGLLR